jgi:hypothetical protein
MSSARGLNVLDLEPDLRARPLALRPLRHREQHEPIPAQIEPDATVAGLDLSQSKDLAGRTVAVPPDRQPRHRPRKAIEAVPCPILHADKPTEGIVRRATAGKSPDQIPMRPVGVGLVEWWVNI